MAHEINSIVMQQQQRVRREHRLPQTFGLRSLLEQIQLNRESKQTIENLTSQLKTYQLAEKKASYIRRVRKQLFAASDAPSMELLTNYTDVLGITLEELAGEHIAVVREEKKKEKPSEFRFSNNDLLGKTLLYLYVIVDSSEIAIGSSVLKNLIEEIYSFCQENNRGRFDTKAADRIVYARIRTK